MTASAWPTRKGTAPRDRRRPHGDRRRTARTWRARPCRSRRTTSPVRTSSAVATPNGITGSFNAGDRVLTLTGSATVAQLRGRAAVGDLRQQQHQPLDLGPHRLGRRQRRHGELEHRHAQPRGRRSQQSAGGGDDGSALAFTEGNSATAIDAGLTVTDADNTQPGERDASTITRATTSTVKTCSASDARTASPAR